ncbi:MAG: glycine cleavage system aminomethyltransferase GcvT [Candidatus Eremiobacteraeota bacterium]|nr:glycine cleavage system aminomethyltransferase GcvT [Candidatus Eremiobacteraeota bacterium]
MTKTLQKTALSEVHRAAGAKMVDFAGWDMPVQYTGVKEEHEHVRSQAGLFDLSHMGEIEVVGEKAFETVQGLVTNDLHRIEAGQCLYTCMVNQAGRVLDDMLIYRFEQKFWLVVNASNREKIWKWMNEQVKTDGVVMTDLSARTSLVAVQGPRAQEALAPLVDFDLDGLGYYRFVECQLAGQPVLLSRTGYTGEDGFEIYLEWDRAVELWNLLRDRNDFLAPIGLGARDTLRLESGYALYGHELSEEITPYDAGLAWVVRLDQPFIGRDSLAAQKEAGLTHTVVGLEMEGKAIPREGYQVFHQDRQVGRVTSGTFSPSLKKGIGLALVELEARAPGTALEIDIRGRRNQATVVRPPFVRGSVRRG